MASVSYSIARGLDGFKIADYTHGTLATNANDVELRVNLLDGNGVALTIKDVIKALEAFERAVVDGTMFKSDFGV